MLKLSFYFLQIVLKIFTFRKSDNNKSCGIKQNQQIIYIVSRYPLSLSRFPTKIAKLSQSTQCLHSLFTKLWDAIFYLF